MDMLYVGIGGALGSLARYQLGKIIALKTKAAFPVGTFIINISGAFLLGLLSSINMHKTVYLLVGDGFLGAYTTFSTFMYEGFQLIKNNRKLNAFIYISMSLLLGIIGYASGFVLGKVVNT